MKNSIRPLSTQANHSASANQRNGKHRGRALGMAQPLDLDFALAMGLGSFELPSCDVPSEPEVEEAWDHFQHECYELYPLNRR